MRARQTGTWASPGLLHAARRADHRRRARSAMKIVPAYIEYCTVKKAIAAIAQSGELRNASVADVRKRVRRAARRSTTSPPSGRSDLEITKEGGEVVIAFAYRRSASRCRRTSRLVHRLRRLQRGKRQGGRLRRVGPDEPADSRRPARLPLPGTRRCSRRRSRTAATARRTTSGSNSSATACSTAPSRASSTRASPQLPEGELSRLRASLVREESLAEIAQRHRRSASTCAWARASSRSGGAGRPSILADALEAVFGAVFLDGGFEAARRR